MLIFRQVCRVFHNVAFSSCIWVGLALDYQCRSRMLAMDDFIHPSTLLKPSMLSDLRRVVCRTAFLERNWSSRARPMQACHRLSDPSFPIKFSRPHRRPITLDYPASDLLYASSFFLTEDYFVISSKTGRLLGWDLKNVASDGFVPRIGQYNMDQDLGLHTFRTDHATKTVYALTESLPSSPLVNAMSNSHFLFYIIDIFLSLGTPGDSTSFSSLSLTLCKSNNHPHSK